MKIEVGTILIATDPCFTKPSNRQALIVGKEYPVIEVDDYMLTILSEGCIVHHFYLDSKKDGYFRNYFGVKGEVDVLLVVAQHQRYTALVNAFSTIEAFAVPSYTPLYEGYDQFRKYLLEMYKPNK